MDRKNILDKAKSILEGALNEIDLLYRQIDAEESYNEALMTKINKIESDVSEVKRGIIG